MLLGQRNEDRVPKGLEMMAEEGKIKNNHRSQIEIAAQGNREVVVPGGSRRWKPSAELGRSLGCLGKILLSSQAAAQMSS